MSRYVLRYRGGGQPPVGELALIERTLRVLDRSPRMLLVEGSGNGIRQVLAGLPGWVADEEAVVPVPTTGPALAPRSS
ncbi:MAG TPA: hypothetical protein VHK25_04065 [Acidimicrobiales bacterium]|nr:hypothetical protein [Acidimicrobiales bacterium]